MDCQKFAALLDDYACLSDEQLAELEEHAMDCELCRAELEFLKSVIGTAASLPTIEPPADLLSRINDEIDKQNAHIGVRTFDRIARNIRANTRRYATAAACLLVGVIVGLNSGMITDRLDGKNDDGVISEHIDYAEKTQAPEAVQPSAESVPAAESEPETEADTQKTESVAEPEIKETQTAVSYAAPQQNKEDSAVTGYTAESDETEKPVWSAPVKTSAPSKATEQPTVSYKPETAEKPTEENENKYVMSAEYHMPDEYAYSGENDVPEEEITEHPGVESYSLATEQAEYSYADNGTDTRSVKSNPDQLIIDVSAVDQVVSIMNELGVENSGVAYIASYDTFYALLERLDSAGISYSYTQNSFGDNVSFKIILI